MEQAHCDGLTSAGWPDAAYGGQKKEGRRCPGYVIAILSPTRRRPRHFSHKSSEFTRKLVEGSYGSDVPAFSDKMGHVATLSEFYAPFVDSSPGVGGLGDCQGLFTHSRNRRTVAEEYLVRHFASIHRALEQGQLGNVFWPPGPGNPADGLTKATSDSAPLLNLLNAGSFFPGTSRSLEGVATRAFLGE